METFGKRVKHHRELLGLSQFELSHRSNVSQASIARIESGKQKNLKRETIRKLSDGLGISLTELMEPLAGLKEERVPYAATRMVPVVKLKDIENIKELTTLTKKADKHEPSLSPDRHAFYLTVSAELLHEPVIREGDKLLIEPAAQIREGDMVLCLSPQKKGIGTLYYRDDSHVILPLGQNMPPLIFKKADKKRRILHIFRISEIKKVKQRKPDVPRL